jgi:hypothetical protein
MMNKTIIPLQFLLPFLLILGFPDSATADDSPRHQMIDHMDIYLGVMPSELVLGHPAMHHATPPRKHRYHVLVALFDSKTGNRITNAEIKARITGLGGFSSKEKKLESMHVADAPSYGSYFFMPDPGMYRIQLEIRRPDSKRTSTAEFMFERPRD